jgi:hypothetical protein
VKMADPFRGHCTVPLDVDLASTRVYLEMLDLPGEAARVTVNGAEAGGLIGKPCRLDVSAHVRSGMNQFQILPLAPKAARLVFYGRGPTVERSNGTKPARAAFESAVKE